MLGSSEITFIAEGLRADVRNDGRQRREWRAYDLDLGVAPHAQGSAKLSVDGTEVLVGVSCSVVECQDPEVEVGSIRLEVDIAPSALKGASQGTNGGNAALFSVSKDHFDLAKMRHLVKTNLQNVLMELLGLQQNAASVMQEKDSMTRVNTAQSDKLLAQASAVAAALGSNSTRIDLSELYVGSGHCLELVVDISLLGLDGGNVYGLTSLALKAALLDTKLPNVTVSQGVDGTTSISIDNDVTKCQPLKSAATCPLLVGFVVHDGSYALDASLEEEMLPTHIVVGISSSGGVASAAGGDMLLAQTVSPIRATPVVSKPVLMEDLLVLMDEGATLGQQVDLSLLDRVRSNNRTDEGAALSAE